MDMVEWLRKWRLRQKRGDAAFDWSSMEIRAFFNSAFGQKPNMLAPPLKALSHGFILAARHNINGTAILVGLPGDAYCVEIEVV
jgi:hypothetical protein